CPFQAGMAGYVSYPQPIAAEDKVRGNPELFSDHYSQAQLFWNSQSAVEQAHIIAAFRFELTRVQVPAIRERVLSLLANIHPDLAGGVAQGLGMFVPAPMPLASSLPTPTYPVSPALSLLFRPGQTGIRTKRIAILVGHGVETESIKNLYADLLAEGAVPRLVGCNLGRIKGLNGDTLDIEISLEAGPPVLYDAVIVADSDAAILELSKNAHSLDFLRQQYRHCKPMLAIGSGVNLLSQASIPSKLPDGRGRTCSASSMSLQPGGSTLQMGSSRKAMSWPVSRLRLLSGSL
ncbi:MAG: hypothetical protein EOP50_08680, partial [Sphingobacteriales bacterium]